MMIMHVVIAKAGTSVPAMNSGRHHDPSMYMPLLSQAERVSVVFPVAVAVTVTVTLTVTALLLLLTVTVDATDSIVDAWGHADEATTRRSQLEQAGSLEPTLPFGVTMIARAWQDNWLCEIASRFHQDSGLGCGPSGHGVQQTELANGQAEEL